MIEHLHRFVGTKFLDRSELAVFDSQNIEGRVHLNASLSVERVEIFGAHSHERLEGMVPVPPTRRLHC